MRTLLSLMALIGSVTGVGWRLGGAFGGQRLRLALPAPRRPVR